MGSGDPCLRVDSPAKVRYAVSGLGDALTIEVGSRDGDSEIAIDGANDAWLKTYSPGLLGLNFEPPIVEGPRKLRDVARRFSGLLLPRVPLVFPRLVQIVLQQLVSFRDACYAWRQLVLRYGEPIPGRDDWYAPPTPAALARLPVHAFVDCGVLPRHARCIRNLAVRADRIEATWDGGTEEGAADRTCELLAKLPGVGPWTIGYLRGSSLGDADAVVPGDYSFPRWVNYFFTGRDEPASDDDMLRLLEPYRPHRYYVLLLITKSGRQPPRRGPKRAPLRRRLKG